MGSSQPPPPQAYGLQASAYALDVARPPPSYNHYGAGGYPPYPAVWDPYAYPYGGFSITPARRDEGVAGRRLSDRISGVAAPGFDQAIETLPVPASAGLPAKPAVSLDSAPAPRRGRGAANGPSPPPPPDAKEDPRAQAGKKVSYVDVDRVAEGELSEIYRVRWNVVREV